MSERVAELFTVRSAAIWLQRHGVSVSLVYCIAGSR